MKTLAIIPARMGSSRFPGKPLKEILGMPMIGHVYHRTKLSNQVDDVYVATCDLEIKEYIESIGGKAVMTKDTHERCTDRTAEAVETIEKNSSESYDIILMVQGDEPMLVPESLNIAISEIKNDSSVQVVNLMTKLKSVEEQRDVNEVKVVCDRKNNALYFSREPIPSPTFNNTAVTPFKQVCIIPFRKQFLFDYQQMEPTPLEINESIDMLRILEHGHRVRMVEVELDTYAVDTLDDLKKVEELIANDPTLKVYK